MPSEVRAPAEIPAQANRDAILEAAARMIAANGVRGFRVEKVAAEAGVSPPLLYYHFDDRQGLVKAALAYAGEQAPSTGLDADLDGRTGYEAIEAALLAEFDDDPQVHDHAVVWGEVAASAVFDPDLRDDLHAVVAQWRDKVAMAIAGGLDDGSIRPDVDPVPTADILVSLVDGLCTRWLSGGLSLERARSLMRDAIYLQLDPAAGRRRR
jgi:AcrR family transcriptional regulator